MLRLEQRDTFSDEKIEEIVDQMKGTGKAAVVHVPNLEPSSKESQTQVGQPPKSFKNLNNSSNREYSCTEQSYARNTSYIDAIQVGLVDWVCSRQRSISSNEHHQRKHTQIPSVFQLSWTTIVFKQKNVAEHTDECVANF